MDTVQIKIGGRDKFEVSSWAQFVPEFSIREFCSLSSTEQRRGRTGDKVPYLRRFVLHPSNTDGVTIPKVEIYERVDVISKSVMYEMSITFSVPKLLNENNLTEITQSDLQKSINTTVDRLHNVGIRISPTTIASASVSVVHFCKNIVLPPSISLRRLLTEIAHADVGKAYDSTSKQSMQKSKNDYKTLSFYCGTRSWCFYDKIADIKRPKNKSEDKHKTEYEKELLIASGLENSEVFRYEYRLNKMQTIKSELNVLLGRTYQTQVSFTDLFTDGLWKAILLKSWRRIIDRPENQLAFLGTSSTLDLFLHILKNARTKNKSAHSQNQALWSYGLVRVIKDHGVKTVREELGKEWSVKSDERLDDKIATAIEFAHGIPSSDDITYITKQLEQFKVINLA